MVVAIGLNYLDHVRESGLPLPERPLVFAKFPSSTVGNDVSARDVQFGDGQWVRGKSLDTFCPLGPAVVTREAIPDPQALRLTTTVNGETVQDSTTAEMVFGVAELLQFCSRSFTLVPGDVLLTGTPWGCGEFRAPPRSLRDGDVVEAWVEGIGTLRNTVRDRTA